MGDINLNLKDISTERTVTWMKAFIRNTGEPINVFCVNNADGALLYYDANDKMYLEDRLCIPIFSCRMDDSFNASGNAVLARVKKTEQQIEAEPIEDNGFVFYRDKDNNVYSILELVISNQRVVKRPEVFKTLEDRMLYYRSKPEQYIPKNSYVLVMLDGRSFSQKIKKKYKRPFDDNFIKLMNDTAGYVCSQVQGAKFAYVQSDEISIFLSDADTPESTLFYDGRLVKLLSVIPSIATSYFNRHVLDDKLEIENLSANDIRQIVQDEPVYQFDAKVWSVPTLNDVFGWFLYRQNDCIRNSKQQAAQTYLPHNKLKKKHTDEQIQMLLEEKNIDWHTAYDDGKKFGRFVYKETEHFVRIWQGEEVPYDRSVWKAHHGTELNIPEGKEWFMKTLIEPCSFPETDSVKKTFVDILKENQMYYEKIQKNLAYLMELNEVLPEVTDDISETILDEHYSDDQKMIQQLEMISAKLKEEIANNS